MSKDKNKAVNCRQKSLIDYIFGAKVGDQTPQKTAEIIELKSQRKPTTSRRQQAIDRVVCYSKSLEW